MTTIEETPESIQEVTVQHNLQYFRWGLILP